MARKPTQEEVAIFNYLKQYVDMKSGYIIIRESITDIAREIALAISAQSGL